jgi:hypothetical protein
MTTAQIRRFGFAGAMTGFVAVMAPGGLTATPVCEQAWERAERIRVEIGLRPGPAYKSDELVPEKACRLILDKSDQELRAMIMAQTEICGGDCRDLVEDER